MTTGTAREFLSSNGTFDTVAAMNAGHDARTEALRELSKIFARFLKSSMQPHIGMPALGNSKA